MSFVVKEGGKLGSWGEREEGEKEEEESENDKFFVDCVDEICESRASDLGYFFLPFSFFFSASSFSLTV